MAKAPKPAQTGGTPPPGLDGEEGLSGLVRTLRDLGEQHENVSVHQIREEIGERSFGPFLVIPALIEISPIGGIPGLPTAIAIIVSLFAVQILFGAKHLWLPSFVENRKLPGDRLKRAMAAIGPAARWTDRLLRPRLRWLTRPPGLQVIAALCLCLAATVPPLEVFPFASSLPMGAIALSGLALMVRDGLVALIAGGLAAGTGYMLYMSFA